MFKLNTSPIHSWLKTSQKPLVIAGPCSAETEEQVIETAKQIAANNDISALRAGIWKPRTRTNAFEGVGEEGLKWLVKAGKEINKPVITEVANAQHVEKALKAGVDMLWLGARTTVNPFFVQEIADALDGIDIPVLVKNPINPDVQLWIGALERLNKVGVTKLAAVHRGFSSFEKSVYRNVPMWEIPIQLKSTFPELEIFCDPSHIAGNASLIGEVCQQADHRVINKIRLLSAEEGLSLCLCLIDHRVNVAVGEPLLLCHRAINLDLRRRDSPTISAHAHHVGDALLGTPPPPHRAQHTRALKVGACAIEREEQELIGGDRLSSLTHTHSVLKHTI